MAGKKKKGKKRKGKKGKKKGASDPLDAVGDDIKAMSLETLTEEIEAARAKLMDSKIRRNYIQNEKDLIKQCYEISNKEVMEIEAEIVNKDAEMEKYEENH
jgi:hypothetical protein